MSSGSVGSRYRGVLCLSIAVVLSSGILQVNAGEPYYGKFLGSLRTQHHGVTGDVYVVDSRNFHIRNFNYDGEGPAAYFYAGNSKAPSSSGFQLRDEKGKSLPLRKYRNEHVTITLPDGKTLNHIKWLSVWCDEYAVNFADVKIPKNFEYPKPQKIGQLNGIHGVSSDNVIIVDAQTLLIQSFSYDGEAPDAKFWVGRGPTPSPQGIRVPDENGKETPLKRYNRKHIVLTLPRDLTVFDIGHFGVWCEAFTVDFGHVEIPQGNLNVPPSLKMLGVSPQSKLNCEVLHDDLAFEVRWAVAGDSIVLQLVAKLEDGEYMSFGLSGDDKKNKMIGGDVVVAWINHETLSGYAVDYYLDDKSQCSGPRGSCPDDKLQEGSESVRLLNAALVNGYSIVTYQRQLKAHDTYDKAISTNSSQAVIWAIGPLNTRQEVSYHSITSKGDILLDFGRSPKWNCPIPDSDATLDMSSERPTESSYSSSPTRIQQQETTRYTETVPTEPLRTQVTTIKAQATPAPAPKGDAWDIPPIECNEPEDGVFYAQLGPTGGKRGYPAITGHVGWGLCWYINGLLIPVINVVRGKTYTFVVEGGLDAGTPAKYHPFYITDDPVGGYHYKTPEERAKVNIFAGVSKSKSGELEPNGVGRSCNWTPDASGPPSDDFVSFGAYQRTLSLICDHGEPGIVQWTPDENTPDTVYYQCYTHRYLGWKINVLDECDKESPAAAASETVTTKVAFDGSEDDMKDGNDVHEEDEEEGDDLETRASYQVSVKVKPDGGNANEFIDKTSSKEFEENLSLIPTHAKENLVKDEKNEIVPPPQPSYASTGFQYFDNGNNPISYGNANVNNFENANANANANADANYGQATSTIYGKQTSETVNSPQNYDNPQNYNSNPNNNYNSNSNTNYNGNSNANYNSNSNNNYNSDYNSFPPSSTSTTAGGTDFQANGTNAWNVYNGDVDYGSDTKNSGDNFNINVGNGQSVDYTSNSWNVHYGYGSGYGGGGDNYKNSNYSNGNNNYNDANTASTNSNQESAYNNKPAESTQSTSVVSNTNAYKNVQNNYFNNTSAPSASGGYTTIKEQTKRPEQYIRPDSQSEESIDVPNYYNNYNSQQAPSTNNQIAPNQNTSPVKQQNPNPNPPSSAYAHVTFTTDHKYEDQKKGPNGYPNIPNGGKPNPYIPNIPRPNMPYKGAYVLNPNQRPNRPPFPAMVVRPQYQKRPGPMNGYQNQQRLSNRPPMAVIAAAQNQPRPVIVKKPISRIPPRPNAYGQPGTRPPHVKSQPPKIIPVSFPAVKYTRPASVAQPVTEKIKTIPPGKPINPIQHASKPIPVLNSQPYQKEPGSPKLNLAVNTGFNPGSVVIESGFRPIVQNTGPEVPEKDRAQERMAEGLGEFIDDNESEQSNKYLKEDGNIGTITLPEESKASSTKPENNQTKSSEDENKNPFEGQKPVSFEPMFIPSPLDSITQQKYSYKKPTELVAFQKKPYLRKPIRQSMVMVRPQPMVKRVPVIKVPIFYEKEVAPSVQPLPLIPPNDEAEEEVEAEEEDGDDDEEVEDPSERLDTFYLPPSGPIYGVPKNGQVLVPASSNGLVTSIVSYDGKPVRNVQIPFAQRPVKRVPGNLMLKVPIISTSDNQMTFPKIYAVQLGNQAPQVLPQPVEPQALALESEDSQYESEEKEDSKKSQEPKDTSSEAPTSESPKAQARADRKEDAPKTEVKTNSDGVQFMNVGTSVGMRVSDGIQMSESSSKDESKSTSSTSRSAKSADTPENSSPKSDEVQSRSRRSPHHHPDHHGDGTEEGHESHEAASNPPKNASSLAKSLLYAVLPLFIVVCNY